MNATLRLPVGKNKKPPEESPEAERDVKYNASVKLATPFKEKLFAVAADLGLFPGQLVERHMGDYVATEYLRVLKKRLEEAEREARGRKGSG